MNTNSITPVDRIRVRRGLTLLELILALALTTLLLVAISMALSMHLRTLESRRSHVEEAHLARAILTHIATDLRNAVAYEAFDNSGAESVMAEEDELLDEAAEDFGLTDPSEEETKDGASLTSTLEPPPLPGIYGNQYELQIDTSRLPRVDEYHPEFATTFQTATQIPSDIKTVTYYVQSDDLMTGMQPMGIPTAAASASAPLGVNNGQPVTGLIRRELDRAVAQWAFDSGTTDTLNSAGEILAPEVMGIEFSYFDGTNWLTEWNTEEYETLPVAVQITLMLLPLNPSEESTNNLAVPTVLGPNGLPQEVLYYQQIVHLPLGRPVETESTTSDEELLGL